MRLDEIVMIVAGLVAIGAVNWWFLGKWPGHEQMQRGHHH